MSLQETDVVASTAEAVRDNRGKDWFWANNALYDEIVHPVSGETTTFANALGTPAIGVYLFLARLADNRTQTCYPGYATIEKRVGISHGTAVSAVHKLRDHGLILRQERDTEEGDRTSNLYTLLPIESWNIRGGIADILPSVRDRLSSKKSKKKTTGGTPAIPGVIQQKYDGGTPVIPKQDSGNLTLKEQNSQQQQSASADAAVVHSNSDELEAASSSSVQATKSDNRVLELPQSSGAAAQQPSASQKRARRDAEKQFDAGQTTLPQVAASPVKRQPKTAPVVEKLLAIGTGADSQVIVRYASLHPEHAEKVVRYFPGTRENTQEYWDDYNARKGTDFTRANGLIQRLKNPQWEPPQLHAERIRKENAEQARIKREREAAEHEAAQRAEKEDAENMARINDNTVSEYRSLPLDAREAVREKVWHCSNFLRDRARELALKGALPPLLEGAPESALLDGWTRQHTEYRQWAVILRQAMLDVARERPELFDDEEFEDFESLPPVSEDEYTAIIVERLAVEVLDDVTGIGELDTRRAKQGPAVEEDDELWEKICAGVKSRVLEKAA